MIAGIEPGHATAEYIDHVVSRVSVIGAVYLVTVCVIPEILVAKIQVPFYLGGTSLLIMICAILDVKAQLEGVRQVGWRRPR